MLDRNLRVIPRLLTALLLLAGFGAEGMSAETGQREAAPKQIGARTAVINFVEEAGGNPTDFHVISTESLAVSDMAIALLESGQLNATAKGVTKISDDHYQLTVMLPVSDDAAPLAAGTTPPVPRIRPCPVYPNKLRSQNITGGVVLRLSIDEKARLQKVELISASHPEFGPVAIQAVEKWVFGKPALKDGKPVTVTMLQLVTFEFEGGRKAALPWQISREPALSQYIVTTAPPRPPDTKAAK